MILGRGHSCRAIAAAGHLSEKKKRKSESEKEISFRLQALLCFLSNLILEMYHNRLSLLYVGRYGRVVRRSRQPIQTSIHAYFRARTPSEAAKPSVLLTNSLPTSAQ